MPVYNYSCNDCGLSFSVIVKKFSKKIKLKCEKCGSTDISKVKEPVCRRHICPNFN